MAGWLRAGLPHAPDRHENGLALATLQACTLSREMTVAELQALWPKVQETLQEELWLTETGNDCVHTATLGGMRCCMFQTLGTLGEGGMPVELVMYAVCVDNTLYELDLLMPQVNYFAEGTDMAQALYDDVTDALALKESLVFAPLGDAAPQPTDEPRTDPMPTPQPAAPTPEPDASSSIPRYKASNATLEPIDGTDLSLYTDLDRGFSIELPAGVSFITPDKAYARLVDYYWDEPVGEAARRMEAWLLDSITYETTLFILPQNAGMVGVIAQNYHAETLEEIQQDEKRILESMVNSGYYDVRRVPGGGNRYVLGGDTYYLLPVTLRLSDKDEQTVLFKMLARSEGDELREINLWETADTTDEQSEQLKAMIDSIKFTGVQVETRLNGK